MALKHGILGILNYSDMSGYDLMKTFESSLSYFWHVKTSQIYLELDNLSKAGLVISRKEIQDGRPNKNIFSITKAGKEELKNWMTTYSIKKSFNIKNEFLMLIFFLNELPKNEALEILEIYKKECSEKMENLKFATENVENFKKLYSIENNSHIFWSLTVKHGEFCYRAFLEWADFAIDTIKNKI